MLAFSSSTSGANDLPDYLDLPKEEIYRHWGQWLLWRSTGRRLDFSAAQSVPASLLNVIMLLDDLYGRIEAQHEENVRANKAKEGSVDAL